MWTYGGEVSYFSLSIFLANVANPIAATVPTATTGAATNRGIPAEAFLRIERRGAWTSTELV
jgi:hypothetical protein